MGWGYYDENEKHGKKNMDIYPKIYLPTLQLKSGSKFLLNDY